MKKLLFLLLFIPLVSCDDSKKADKEEKTETVENNNPDYEKNFFGKWMVNRDWSNLLTEYRSLEDESEIIDPIISEKVSYLRGGSSYDEVKTNFRAMESSGNKFEVEFLLEESSEFEIEEGYLIKKILDTNCSVEKFNSNSEMFADELDTESLCKEIEEMYLKGESHTYKIIYVNENVILLKDTDPEFDGVSTNPYILLTKIKPSS